ncbi:aspartate aminotransferase family protein [Glaciibacter psychrotolerans]|uniref:4-aminobutyrate aminotransferase-like enzyme n=1 Tax=Glaciibacter psychrotolerans TaxID=670054 RepID=A0A7Z0J634_9MICO|nr:4-aminobutyrate aminotransferase-like enzyme [Leifsonia psychrotolerans]
MVGPSSYFTPSRIDELAAEQRELVGRRERLLGNAYRLFYDQPVEIVRGSGTLLYDADGTEYLDVYNNVPSVGHSHPRVVEAIARQAAQLNTHTRYLNRGIVDYSSDLLATLPDGLDNAMFTCTGSEANDLALRLAKAVTGHAGVIVTRNAYHGVTTEIAAISPSLGGLDTVAPWVRVVEAPVGDGLTFVRQVAAAINELRDSPHGLAAVIVDTIFASDGVRPAPTAPGSPGFLAPVVAAAHAAGGLVIADEVQAGFGRLGSWSDAPHRFAEPASGLWGFSRHGIVPDIVTLGKPMGNGMPIAAMLARRDLVDEFGSRMRYFNTFGGNPVSIAAAQATLNILRDEQLPLNARRVGDSLRAQLRDLAHTTPELGEIRGAGLFIGIDIIDADGRPDEARTIALLNELRRRHVLIGASGLANSTLKVRPPLLFSPADADRFLTELAGAVQAVRGSSTSASGTTPRGRASEQI